MDGALGFNLTGRRNAFNRAKKLILQTNQKSEIRVVIEMKNDKIKNLDAKINGKTAVQQALNYAKNIKECEFVIVSNFREMRIRKVKQHLSLFSSFEYQILNSLSIFSNSFF